MNILMLDAAVVPMLILPILALLGILALCTLIAGAAAALIHWIVKKKKEKQE